jgi:hypothetical protein
MILDTEMIETFQEEAKEIIQELHEIVERLEDHKGPFPKGLLEEFANKADRIMGTAKTFESMAPDHKVFQQLGKFGELCKATGYKASVLNIDSLIPIFAAFWADTLDIMSDLVSIAGEADPTDKMSSFAPVLHKRLTWLAKQIVSLTKGTAAEGQAAINVDGILRKMGILE